MSDDPNSKTFLRPWQWGLPARLGWALLTRPGGTDHLADVVEHIVRSHRVQTTDLAGGAKGEDRFDVLSMAAEKTRPLAGWAMEFGVFQGVTLRHLAGQIGPGRGIVGFDTFEGLPDDWGQLLPKGTFATSMPSLEGFPNAQLRVGRIEETLPKFLAGDPQPVPLVHIDCPYYGINVFILEHLLPRMPEGSVVVFDEYYGFPSYEEHEFRAWAEIRARFELATRPLAYSSRSAAFEILRNPRCAR